MEPLSAELHRAILARIVQRSKDQKVGRTQLMKLCYFLQEIEQVPTRYDFRLFNYGPFDAEVLSDLGDACNRNLLQESAVILPRGYAYQITPGDATRNGEAHLPDDLATKIDRVVQAFHGESAGELELKSTVLFVDREFERNGEEATVELMAQRVHSIKPHFAADTIRGRILWMKSQSFLATIS